MTDEPLCKNCGHPMRCHTTNKIASLGTCKTCYKCRQLIKHNTTLEVSPKVEILPPLTDELKTDIWYHFTAHEIINVEDVREVTFDSQDRIVNDLEWEGDRSQSYVRCEICEIRLAYSTDAIRQHIHTTHPEME